MHTLLRFREQNFAVFDGLQACSFKSLFWNKISHPSSFCGGIPPTTTLCFPYVRHVFGAKDSPTCAYYPPQVTAAANAVFLRRSSCCDSQMSSGRLLCNKSPLLISLKGDQKNLLSCLAKEASNSPSLQVIFRH